ncbi:MAG: 30S ribosomal protein S17 [Deltaproteobacteria bacterium]|nr:30S ribosomal protein S17 [Deltaproteobacteria bacterium]
MSETRKKRKTIVGNVVGDKMNKTVVVSVETIVKDPTYGKYLKRKIKFKAHDEKNESKVGDRVAITETRPLSKTKRWRVEQILEKAR